MYSNVASNALVAHQNGILFFNRMLEEKAALHHLNEERLVQFLDMLEETSFFHDDSYWLSLARISEIASRTRSMSFCVLFHPRLIRTAPPGAVPRVSWTSGAQCRPVLTAIS